MKKQQSSSVIPPTSQSDNILSNNFETLPNRGGRPTSATRHKTFIQMNQEAAGGGSGGGSEMAIGKEIINTELETIMEVKETNLSIVKVEKKGAKNIISMNEDENVQDQNNQAVISLTVSGKINKLNQQPQKNVQPQMGKQIEDFVKDKNKVSQNRRPMSAKPTNNNNKTQLNKFMLQNQDENNIIQEEQDYSPQHNTLVRQASGGGNGNEIILPNSSTSHHSQTTQAFQQQNQKTMSPNTRYGVRSSYTCKGAEANPKLQPQVRPYSALILAIKEDKHPSLVDDGIVQSATQTQEWISMIKETDELEAQKKLKRIMSSKALASQGIDNKPKLIPEEFLKQAFYKSQSRDSLLGSQCPNIIASTTSNREVPKIGSTSSLYTPTLTAHNARLVLHSKQERCDVKYRSPSFEQFQNIITPAIRKIEYYKIHKSLYDYKRDYDIMQREGAETLQRIMPIYTKEDIIQIKGGNVHPVLSYNAKVRPNSASSRVLLRETDPLSKLKRRFYRNSNKPLGNVKAKTLTEDEQAQGLTKKQKTDYYSKREQTAIKELYKDINIEKKSKEQMYRTQSAKAFNIFQKDTENSMLKSDIDYLNEDDMVIDELDEDEPVYEVMQEHKDYKVIRTQGIMDNTLGTAVGGTTNNTTAIHNYRNARPQTASYQRPTSAAATLGVKHNFVQQNQDEQKLREQKDQQQQQQQELKDLKQSGNNYRPKTGVNKVTNYQRIMMKNVVQKPAQGNLSTKNSSNITNSYQNNMIYYDRNALARHQSELQMQKNSDLQDNHNHGQMSKQGYNQKKGGKNSYCHNGHHRGQVIEKSVIQYCTYNASKPQSPIYPHLLRQSPQNRIQQYYNLYSEEKPHQERQLSQFDEVQPESNDQIIDIKEGILQMSEPIVATSQEDSDQTQQPLQQKDEQQLSSTQSKLMLLAQQTSNKHLHSYQKISQPVVFAKNLNKQNSFKGLQFSATTAHNKNTKTKNQSSQDENQSHPQILSQNQSTGEEHEQQEDDELERMMNDAPNLKQQKPHVMFSPQIQKPEPVQSYQVFNLGESLPKNSASYYRPMTSKPSVSYNKPKFSNMLLNQEQTVSQPILMSNMVSPHSVMKSTIELSASQKQDLVFQQNQPKVLFKVKKMPLSIRKRSAMSNSSTNNDNMDFNMRSAESGANQPTNKEQIVKSQKVLKGSKRVRPISASVNQKNLSSFYKTLDIQFGTSNTNKPVGDPSDGAHNSQNQRKTLLKYLEQDYQGLSSANQPYGMGSSDNYGTIGRLVKTKMPISQYRSMPQLELIQENIQMNQHEIQYSPSQMAQTGEGVEIANQTKYVSVQAMTTFRPFSETNQKRQSFS